MNLAVTHGARLIFRGLIVSRPDWASRRQIGIEGVALQTEHIDQADFEQPGIGRAVRRMATTASFGLYRHMLVYKRPLLVDMALVANEIPARQRADLTNEPGAMRVVAIVALNQTFIDTMVKRFREICLGGDVAPVAQLGLALHQQVLAFFGVVGRVAIKAANVAAGVGGFRKMRLLAAFAVAGEAAGAGLLA